MSLFNIKYHLSFIQNPKVKIQNPVSNIQYPISNILNVNGHTILELVTAISITLIISTLIFTAYLAIFKEFKFYTRKADRVMETVLVKKRMDALLKDIKTVTATYKTTLEYLDFENKDRHILAFRNNALYQDNKMMIKDLKSFEYTISEKQTKTNKRLLLWEAILLNDHWIAGAGNVLLNE